MGWPCRNFVKMFDAGKTRMIGLPYGEKNWQYFKLFSSDTGALWTDRQTDGQNCYINIACQCADAQKNLKNDTLTRTPDPIRPTRWSPVPNHPTGLPPRGFCPGAGNVSVVISHYWLFSIPVRWLAQYASYWNLAQLLYRYSPGGATSPLQLSGTLITT